MYLNYTRDVKMATKHKNPMFLDGHKSLLIPHIMSLPSRLSAFGDTTNLFFVFIKGVVNIIKNNKRARQP